MGSVAGSVQPANTLSRQGSMASNPVYIFDENDFEDDADIDLDFEQPFALPAAPSPKPSPPAEYALPTLPPPYSRQHIPSSAPSWPTSPERHMKMPQVARPTCTAPPLLSSEASIDANPRPAKRRALPWTQRKAEEDEERAIEETVTENLQCINCGRYGHDDITCTAKPIAPAAQAGIIRANAARIRDFAFTPLPKEKSAPWNTTASAVKESQKQFRASKKNISKGNASVEQMHEAMTTHAKSKAPVSPIFLSDEQKRVLELVVDHGKSVFFTGSAGTGKSVLMRAIIERLKKKHAKIPECFAVTASTGLAACNIGGITLHSFSGIGLGKEDAQSLVKKIKRNAKAKMRWMKTKVLIIDEISMVDGDLFDKLDAIARTLKNNGRPFGGIQLIITGDFFQLPPVPDSGKLAKFAFDANTWGTAIDHTIGLTEVFRQKDPGKLFLY